jgi:hypothetical protein
MSTITHKITNSSVISLAPLRQRLQGRQYQVALYFYMALVAGHFIEHIIQLIQLYVLHMPRAMSMGVLGLYLPGLMRSEVLHLSYNLMQLLGLLLLAHGIYGQARQWWNVAIVLQCWHFFEHALLQGQWVYGRYLFGAPKQTSIGELFLPRIELHFLYVTLVVVPTAMALYHHFAAQRREKQMLPDS